MGRGDRSWRGVGAAMTALLLAACNSTPVPTPMLLPSTTRWPVASAPATPSPAVPESPAAIWQPLHAPALEQTSQTVEYSGAGLLSAEILDAVPFDERLVAVGGDALGARAWSTSDGVTWTRAPDDPKLDGVLLTDVATDGERLVATGYHETRGTGVWESTDGLTWKSVPSDAFANEGGSLTVVNGLTYGPAGFVAVGGGGEGGCEGDDACWDLNPYAWTSRDGTEWTLSRYEMQGLRTEPGSFGEFRDVTATDSGYLAVGGAIWSSRDGAEWTRLDDTSSGVTWRHIIDVDEGFVAFGANPDIGLLAMATSEDGRRWTQAALDDSFNALPETAISSSNGIVVMGTAQEYLEEGVLQHPAFWATTDGEHWTIQQGNDQDPGAVHASARVGSRDVALGSLGLSDESGGPAGVWLRAPLPDEAPPAAPAPVRGSWSSVTAVSVSDAAPTEVFTGGARGLLVDGRVLVVYQMTSVSGSFQGTGIAWVDPVGGRTELGPTTDAAHVAPVLSRVAGRVLVIGGNAPGGSTRIDTYDPTEGRWGTQRRIGNEPRQDTESPQQLEGVTLPDGRILLMYGEGCRTVDPETLRASKLRTRPFDQPFAVLATNGGSVAALTQRTWFLDVASNRWTPGPPLPRVGGTLRAASMPDGRIVALRTAPDGTGSTIEILAADGSGWSVYAAPPDGLPAGSLVALDDRTILSVAAQDVCFEPDFSCENDAHLRSATLDLGDPP